MCLEASPFFHSFIGGVGLAGDEEQLVLDCYWLAKWYSQSPEIFLAMPLLDVRRHVLRTKQIMEMRERAQMAEDDGD